MNKLEKQINGSLYIDLSKKIEATFSKEETKGVIKKMDEIMKLNTPYNFNLWTLNIKDHEVWGLFDSRAGPNGEDLLTIILSEEF